MNHPNTLLLTALILSAIVVFGLKGQAESALAHQGLAIAVGLYFLVHIFNREVNV